MSTTITERLPPEIIMEIFTVCCSERYPIHASLPAQLSHVCSAWRALTLSMPALWANFTVMITEVVKPGLGALLDIHLERSGQSPLSFNVDFNSMGDEIPAAVLGLLAPLVDHSDRWKRVKFPFWPGFAPLFARLTGRLGRLEALDLRIRGIPLDTNEGLDSTFFAVAPRLRRLALGASLPRKIPFPSNQLTELHLGAAPTMELGQFLTLCPCPNLAVLILNPYYPLKATPHSLPPLLHLHTLILGIRDGYSRNPVIEVLDLLTAPSLEKLEVVGLREIQIPRQAFAAFLKRSGCTLQTLSISYKDNLPISTLLSNFHAAPSITHLAIFARGKEQTALDIILHSLTLFDPSDGPLLPNLTTFELQAASFRPTVVNMATSRLGYGLDSKISRLRELILHNRPDADTTRPRDSFDYKGLAVSYRPPHKRPTVFI